MASRVFRGARGGVLVVVVVVAGLDDDPAVLALPGVRPLREDWAEAQRRTAQPLTRQDCGGYPAFFRGQG